VLIIITMRTGYGAGQPEALAAGVRTGMGLASASVSRPGQAGLTHAGRWAP
jgi:hypothetical protein